MNRSVIAVIFQSALALFFMNSHGAVDGTMGTPLGGIGAGGIRFSGNKGNFYVADASPCSMGDFRLLKNSGFMLFTNRNGVVQTSSHIRTAQKNGHIDDDAIYPIYTANPMGINNVKVKLLAFTPVSFDSIDLMCLPYGFFEITLSNTEETEVEAAFAFQMSASTVPIVVPGKGLRTSDTVERSIYAASGASAAVVSVGNDSGFFKTGQFNDTLNDTIAAVAVKLSLPANGAQTIRFVYSWYNKTAPERYYYSNLVNNAGEAADIGVAQFTRLRDNAVGIVTRMRASNFPDWIKDHTLNSLCNLTTNGIYTKDGRHCFTEGMWDVNGTLDQMWHARQIMIMTVPDLVWKELDWWARTQKIDPAGQIHHDMGNPMAELWGWDDKQHPEYDYEPNCDDWVDLNCAFIISVYETFCATGDTAKLKYFWPYLKKTGKRILDQVGRYGDAEFRYTFTSSLNTYDQPGFDVNYYNASLSTPTYKILSILSDMYQDTALKKTYQNAFDNVKTSFKERYLTNNFTPGRFAEALLAGQWLGFFLKLGQYYAQSDIDYALNTMDGYYQPLANGLGFPIGSYEEWAPYLISHYGGLCLQTGRFDQWRALQYDWYERNYLNRNRVFNQELGIPSKVASPIYMATDSSVYKQYISVPVLWRNYYTMLGYFRNEHTGELWLEPNIPPEMNHSIQDGFYLSPEGFGTISALETGDGFINQKITFKPDRPIKVTSIYLRDKSSDSVQVLINGNIKPAIRIGEGYARELKVDYSGTIDSNGIIVDVIFAGEGIRSGGRSPLKGTPMNVLFANVSGRFALPSPWSGKKVSVALYSAKGELIARKTFEKTDIDIRKDFRVSQGFAIIKVRPVH
ncbi:MAG: hypothetical protein JW913_03820 [Chitinispirillaceae bacterium]|nr:hypothetical protein [Chitinispirillaceae bacterium]